MSLDRLMENYKQKHLRKICPFFCMFLFLVNLNKSWKSMLLVPQEDEGRYIPPEGRSYPAYPRSVQSTYLLRPPIGSIRLNHHYHRAIPGPALSLGGGSLEATSGLATHQYVNPVTNHQQHAAVTQQQQQQNEYLPPAPPTVQSYAVQRPYPSPAYPKVVTRYGGSNFLAPPPASSHRYDSDFIPAPTPNPEHSFFSSQGNF